MKCLESFTFYCCAIVFCIFIFCCGYQFGISHAKYSDSTPVEGIVPIDSLVQANDSIKIKIDSLDSVKNAKIIEIETLDNDSTIKLFYELISE